MKANSVIRNTRLVQLKNSHVKISNVFVHNIAVMEKMVTIYFYFMKYFHIRNIIN